jgi:hypothetical protein
MSQCVQHFSLSSIKLNTCGLSFYICFYTLATQLCKINVELETKFDTLFTGPWDPSSNLAQMHQMQHSYALNSAEAQVNTSSQVSQSNYAHYYGF